MEIINNFIWQIVKDLPIKTTEKITYYCNNCKEEKNIINIERNQIIAVNGIAIRIRESLSCHTCHKIIKN